MIGAEAWGCGYCRAKGGIAELRELVEKRKK